MAGLGNKRYMSPKQFEQWKKTPYGRYSTALKKHPFWLFGLPFVATIFFGSVYLSEFTQVRYSARDKKVQMLDEEEALSIGQNKRKVDMRDEYYVCIFMLILGFQMIKDSYGGYLSKETNTCASTFTFYQRLQQLGDLDNWEQVRAPRLPGESQNVWDKTEK